MYIMQEHVLIMNTIIFRSQIAMLLLVDIFIFVVHFITNYMYFEVSDTVHVIYQVFFLYMYDAVN